MAVPRKIRASQAIATGVLAGMTVLVSGCWLANGFIDPTKVGRFPMGGEHSVGIRRVLTPRETPAGPANAAEPSPGDLIPVSEEYRVGPGDTVDVIIDDLLREGLQEALRVQVSAAGDIRIPQLGTIRISGMSEREIEDELKARLKQAQILPDPQVRILVSDPRQRTFGIMGAVGAPGQYAIVNPDLRLLEAVLIARDIAPDVKKLYIIRREGPGTTATELAPPADAVAPEGLIIPPPNDVQDDYASFSTTVGLGKEGPPRKARSQERPAPRPQGNQQQEMEELKDILAPRGSAPAQRNNVRKSSDRPFAPLIYDPQTNEPIEQPTPQVDDAAPGEMDPPQEMPDTPGAPGSADKPEFQWENVLDQTGTQRVIAIDVPALRAGDPRYNVIVRNRDVIEVPVDAGVFYMMGEINRPGVYALNNKEITLKQAIAISGGFGALAWPQRCEIIRREPGTDKQITISVDLDAIFGGIQDDVLLKGDDIVNVGSHFIAPFLFVIRNSFRFTYGFGFVYDRNFADKDSYSSQANPAEIRRFERQQRGLPF